jgi:hypothetical protein
MGATPNREKKKGRGSKKNRSLPLADWGGRPRRSCCRLREERMNPLPRFLKLRAGRKERVYVF